VEHNREQLDRERYGYFIDRLKFSTFLGIREYQWLTANFENTVTNRSRGTLIESRTENLDGEERVILVHGSQSQKGKARSDERRSVSAFRKAANLSVPLRLRHLAHTMPGAASRALGEICEFVTPELTQNLLAELLLVSRGR